MGTTQLHHNSSTQRSFDQQGKYLDKNKNQC